MRKQRLRRNVGPSLQSAVAKRLLPLLSLSLAAPLWAQAPDPPAYYAIENVRVLVGDGQELESATVVLEEGLIVAIGANVEAPAEAKVLDGSGKVLLPGLIDAMTSVGQKAEEQSREQGGGGGFNPFASQGPTIRGPEDRPQTYSWRRAADNLDTESKSLEKWREGGFTSALSFRDEGIFPGTAAVINLGKAEPDDAIVSSDVAQVVTIGSGGGFGAYPGSLMGKISYVRQVFLDAQHYASVHAAYAEDRKGLLRPDYDRALEPLVSAGAGEQPVLLGGQKAKELKRSLALADELGLRPILYGAQQGYAIAEELRSAGAPVLVDLDWPEIPKDRDPDSRPALTALIEQELAPTTPAALQRAGVPFALYSGGLSSPKDVFAAVRSAVAAGLTDAQALTALSIGAAQILGVADSIGTLEEGKIANAVLATDYPWSEGAKIDAVFVDGKLYGGEPEEERAAAEVDVSGTWTLSVDSPQGQREMTAELDMDSEGAVTGSIESELGSTTIDEGFVEGSSVTLRMTLSLGGNEMEASYVAEIDEDELEGSASIGPFNAPLQGTRTASRAGAAEVADAGDSEAPTGPRITLEEVEQLRGPYASYDVLAIRGATVLTVTQGTIENGVVVVEDGKIAAVGDASTRIPRGAHVIEAEGQFLIPGIVDAHSHTAVDGGVNEGSLSVTSMVSIEDVVNPDDINIYRALAGGLTTSLILHGSANPIGGQSAVVKWRWGSDAEGLRFQGAAPGIKFALGENPKRSRMPSFGDGRYPATRMGVQDVIRQAFTQARAYRDAWTEYQAAVDSGARALPPARDLELEALVEILEGERLVHAHCYRADEILQLLRLAEEQGFQIATLQHVLEGYRVADEIARHGAGASTFSDWWGYKVEAYNAIPHNAALMTERGVVVSINSDSNEEMRHLNQEAAKAMKWGDMDETAALALVTINPAIQLGIDDRVGSIEVGKDADLVLYDQNPMSVFAVPLRTFVDGDLYFDRELDLERQALTEAFKQRLLDGGDEESTEEAPSAGTPATPNATPATGPRNAR